MLISVEARRDVFWRHSLHLLMAVFVLCLAMPGASFAQQIPPDVLQEIQRRQGTAGPEQRVSPVDQARETGAVTPPAVQIQQPVAAATAKKRSMLEDDYISRLGDEDIRQYGYDLIAARRVTSEAPVGRISGDYVLGPGDELAVILQGNENQEYVIKVDTEGQLILRGLPPIPAAGRRLSDVRSEIEERVGQAFIGTSVFVSVASIAQIQVVVSGEVAAPGVFPLTSQSTVIDALILANGVKKTGSLRRISVLRDGRAQNVDLYRLLRGQAGVNVQLRDGDRIIVPPIGLTYAVTGDVMRGGIFELPQGVNKLQTKTALEVAGGTIRPRGYDYVVSRLQRNGDEVVEPIGLIDNMIAGDGLVVVRTSARSRGKVRVSGHVRAPGIRALAASKTVGGLLQQSGGFAEGPYLAFAAIWREDPQTLLRRFEALDLLDSSSRDLDKPLQTGDKLIVFSLPDVLFLSSDMVRQVVLNRSYEASMKCRPLAELARVLQDVQTDRFAAVLRGAFVVSANGAAQIADTSSLGDPAIGLLQDDDSQVTSCPGLYKQNPGLLAFALEHVVTISGSVRRPANLPLAGPQSLKVLIETLGGFAREAELSTVEVSEPSVRGEATTFTRKRFDLSQTPLETIFVGPGSGVAIQAVLSDQEPGTVLVSGEVARPGVYTIRRGERLSAVIARAGGMTQRAYPYGAVFTRASVQRAQQAAFRRTSRELNSALTTAALKNNVDAEAIAAAKELSTSLATVEAAGRVVVEADPRVLELREDLDIILEPGDRLFVPKRPNHVLTIGDVLNPGALQFLRGKTVGQYLAETGGIQQSADDGRIFLVYPNGVARPLARSFWSSSSEKVPPGSTIVVPKDTDPLATLQLTREVTSIVSQLALSAASFAVIFDRN